MTRKLIDATMPMSKAKMPASGQGRFFFEIVFAEKWNAEHNRDDHHADVQEDHPK